MRKLAYWGFWPTFAALLLGACNFWEPDDEERFGLLGTYEVVSLEVDGRNLVPEMPTAIADVALVEGWRTQVLISYTEAPGEPVKVFTQYFVFDFRERHSDQRETLWRMAAYEPNNNKYPLLGFYYPQERRLTLDVVVVDGNIFSPERDIRGMHIKLEAIQP